MPSIVGNIIVITVLIALVSVCLREIIGGMKSGSCAGCSGGCASCGKGCASGACVMKKSEAKSILKNIKKPKKL